jgi:biotin carboxyl carrier protein
LIRYEIVIEGITKKVELVRLTSQSGSLIDQYECQIVGDQGTKPRNITIQKRDRNQLVISSDDKVYFVRQMKRTSSDIDFILNGRRVYAHFPNQAGVEDTSVKSDVASLNELVSSNFPAKVVSIKVSKSEKLKEGETILILEAMKMEAQIKAPRDCEVIEIYVQEGEIVPRGAKLVRLKFT